MTHHQAKRPYGRSQSSITSYFSPSSPNYSLPTPSTYNGCSPPLPPNVQSNLLSVGMRVRKSVPEGYKTGSYAFNLFPGAPNPTSSNPSISNPNPSNASTTSKPKTRPRAGNRELTPFCGILKVGGLAQQPWEIYNSSSTSMDDEDNDEMPFLSSQGSTVSNYSIDSSPSSFNNNNSQKRRFFEDDDNDDVVENGTNGGALGERILAVPRRKKWSGKVPESVAIVGQENLRFSNLGMGMGGQDGDFEEADFLVMDEDLEMSG